MSENKEITVEQLLRITADNLSHIPVLVEQIDAIGLPIRQAINNINACLNVFEKASKQTAQPEIQVEEIGEVSKDEIPPDAEVIEL